MKAKNNNRGTVKGTNEADGDKVIFLELCKIFLKIDSLPLKFVISNQFE